MSRELAARIIKSSSGDFVILTDMNIKASGIKKNQDGEVVVLDAGSELPLAKDIPEGSRVQFASANQELTELCWIIG